MSGTTDRAIHFFEPVIQTRLQHDRAWTRGRMVSGMSRCMNAGGDITKSVLKSRQTVYSLRTPWPSALPRNLPFRQSVRGGARSVTALRKAAQLCWLR